MSKEVTDFKSQVIEQSYRIPVLVDFWAKWCAPCRVLTPILEQLAAKHTGEWELVTLNIDTNREIAFQYSVAAIPNTKLFVDGAIRAEFAGALPPTSIELWLKRNVPGRWERKIQEVRTMLANGQQELAEMTLYDVLNVQPTNHEARVLLAKLSVLSSPEKALELTSGVGMGDEQFDLAEAVRTLAHMLIQARTPEEIPDNPVKSLCLAGVAALEQRNFDNALVAFIEAMDADIHFNGDCARKACIAIFKYLGENNEITLKYRRVFATVLYR